MWMNQRKGFWELSYFSFEFSTCTFNSSFLKYAQGYVPKVASITNWYIAAIEWEIYIPYRYPNMRSIQNPVSSRLSSSLSKRQPSRTTGVSNVCYQTYCTCILTCTVGHEQLLPRTWEKSSNTCFVLK
jgi:hypothetical protein